MIEFISPVNSYLGLLLFLFAFFIVFCCVEMTAVALWEKYGDRIRNVFRQSSQ